MTRAPAHLRRHPRAHREAKPGGQGMSIAEVMMAGVVGAVIITSAATLHNVSNRSIQTASSQENVDMGISRDLERIRGMMTSYTWCSGAGTLQPIADTSRCRSTRKANKS